MFTPRAPRPHLPKGAAKYGFQRQPPGGLLRDGVTAFEKPSLAGDKQTAFGPQKTGGRNAG